MSSSKSSQLLREEKEGKSSWRSLTVCLHPIFLCHEAGSGCDKGKERVPKAHIKCDCPLASKVPTLELREGCRKKTRIFYGLFTDKKIYTHFFLEIESMIAKTNFTLGPIEKFIFFVKL